MERDGEIESWGERREESVDSPGGTMVPLQVGRSCVMRNRGWTGLYLTENQEGWKFPSCSTEACYAKLVACAWTFLWRSQGCRPFGTEAAVYEDLRYESHSFQAVCTPLRGRVWLLLGLFVREEHLFSSTGMWEYPHLVVG